MRSCQEGQSTLQSPPTLCQPALSAPQEPEMELMQRDASHLFHTKRHHQVIIKYIVGPLQLQIGSQHTKSITLLGATGLAVIILWYPGAVGHPQVGLCSCLSPDVSVKGCYQYVPLQLKVCWTNNLWIFQPTFRLSECLLPETSLSTTTSSTMGQCH